VDVYVDREGRNLEGRLAELVLGTVGRRRVRRQLDKTVKAIETGNPEQA
jgi:hypothetical protein